MLTQLILGAHESIRASGDDLSNYFYLIKHLEMWQNRNCFGKPIKGHKLTDLGLDPNVTYLPSFRVLCMGDCNGVDLAQATHESLLRAVGCLQPHQTLVYGKIFPASRTLEGLYIDDHLAFQVLDTKWLRARGIQEDEELTAKARSRYQELGLPTSTKNAFDKQYCFKAWGTEIDSQTGLVSSPLSKLRQIEQLAVGMLQGGLATKKAMQKLLGLFVHPFLHRRECMSMFQTAYLFVDKMPEQGCKELTQVLRDELCTAVLLLPLAHANIRWPVSTRIAATDASSKRGGRACTLTTKSFAKSLYRFGERRGEHTRLDWEHLSLSPPSSMTPLPDVLAHTLMKHSWSASQSCAFARKQHINLLEMEMLRQEIKDRINTDQGGCRVVNLCDSRVVVGAFAKGRSSSKRLNHKLRACVPWLLAGDLSVTNLWVDTCHNPADYPSRDRPIPRPVVVDERDPFLEPTELAAVQTHRSVGVQILPSREGHASDNEPIFERLLEEPAPASAQDILLPGESASKPVKLHFREFFVGKACLTKAMRRVLGVKVLPSINCKKVGQSEQILDDNFFSFLMRESKKPNQLWHLGFPCGSFSILQNLNHSARSRTCPTGNQTVHREREGNETYRRLLFLIDSLEAAENFWTFENPKSSFLWDMPDMKSRLVRQNSATLHQCAYGLVLPDGDGGYGPCKKNTRFLGNLAGLSHLSRLCSCVRPHVYATSGVRTKAGWKRRSELAGQYPRPLCNAYAALVSKLCQ